MEYLYSLKMIPECSNSTTTCDCRYNSYLKYDICDCPLFLDPYYFCNQTIFDAYNTLDSVYPSFGIVIYAILFALYMYEFVADILQKKITPILLTKGALITFIVSRLTIFSFWIVSSNDRTNNYAATILFLDSIGVMILVTSLILIVISWLNLVISGKNLGDHDKNMVQIKLSLYILTGIIVSANILFLFLAQFIPKVTVLPTVLTIAEIFLVLLSIATIIISVIYLVIIFRWIKNTKMSDFLRRVQLKSYWLITVLGSLLLTSIILIIRVILQTTHVINQGTPTSILTIEIIDRFMETVIVSLMFFFLERNFLRAVQAGTFIVNTSTTSSN